MTTKTIELTDPMLSVYAACEEHEGLPVHANNECDRLDGVEPFSRDFRCSACDLEWSQDVLVSQHAGCAIIFVGKDGEERREGGTCLTFVRLGNDWPQVIYVDPQAPNAPINA